MKKIYFTKKRKREFELIYNKIDGLKLSINNMLIENKTYLKVKNFAGIESNNDLISQFEKELKIIENDGWVIDYQYIIK